MRLQARSCERQEIVLALIPGQCSSAAAGAIKTGRPAQQRD
jgi:hypothetical protein